MWQAGDSTVGRIEVVVVTWCFTPSQALWLYQGEDELKRTSEVSLCCFSLYTHGVVNVSLILSLFSPFLFPGHVLMRSVLCCLSSLILSLFSPLVSWPCADAVGVVSWPCVDAVGVVSWPCADAVGVVSWPCVDAVGVVLPQFTRDTCKELESIGGRKLVLACDGANGQTVRHLGLSDEYVQHSCRYV